MRPATTLSSCGYSEFGLKSFVEPPYAEPHVRWCGGWAGKPARLPDFWHFFVLVLSIAVLVLVLD
jgi:hypothetical protein